MDDLLSYCQGRFAHRFGGQRVCGNPTISGEQLDDYVWRSVSALLKDPARMLEEWSRRQKSGGVTAELQQHRDDAARAVAAFERTMKRLVDAYEVGAIEVEDLKQRSDTVRARSERAQRELADAETRLRETVQLRAIVTQLDDFAARVRARLDALSWLEKRTILRTLVAKIDIDEKGATIVYRLPSAERTPPPSRANPPSEGTSDQDNRTRCLLRKQRGGLVTGKGLASPLDARIALALPTPPENHSSLPGGTSSTRRRRFWKMSR
jgi:site-specific DNA recombinase